MAKSAKSLIRGLAILFLVFSGLVHAQTPVTDAAVNGQLIEMNTRQKNEQISDLEKYAEIAATLTTLLNNAAITLDKISSIDKFMLTLNANIKCAFDKTQGMLDAYAHLSKKAQDIEDGKFFMTTQALVKKIKSVKGAPTFTDIHSIVSYLDSNYAIPSGGLKESDVGKRRIAKNVNIVLLEAIREQQVKAASEFMDDEANRLSLILGVQKDQIDSSDESQGTQNGNMVGTGENAKPVSVCAASQAATQQRMLLAQMEIMAFTAKMQALDFLYKSIMQQQEGLGIHPSLLIP